MTIGIDPKDHASVQEKLPHIIRFLDLIIRKIEILDAVFLFIWGIQPRIELERHIRTAHEHLFGGIQPIGSGRGAFAILLVILFHFATT